LQTLDINKWLTLIANFGVIAGILILAVEVRQNQQSLDEANVLNRLSASAATLDSYDRFRTMLIENKEVAQIWERGLNGESLDPIDTNRFHQLCSSNIWNQVVAYERYLALGREDSAIGTANSIRSRIEANIGFREHWHLQKNGMRDVGFGFFVDAVEGSAG
jgi:hypothetical protein